MAILILDLEIDKNFILEKIKESVVDLYKDDVMFDEDNASSIKPRLLITTFDMIMNENKYSFLLTVAGSAKGSNDLALFEFEKAIQSKLPFNEDDEENMFTTKLYYYTDSNDDIFTYEFSIFPFIRVKDEKEDEQAYNDGSRAVRKNLQPSIYKKEYLLNVVKSKK